MYLVGTRSDQEESRAVSKEEAREFAMNNGLHYYESSVCEILTVDQIFMHAAMSIA